MNPEEAKALAQQLSAAIRSVGLPEDARALVIVEIEIGDDIQQVIGCTDGEKAFEIMERAIDQFVAVARGQGTPIMGKPS